jgi:hypothetical protein
MALASTQPLTEMKKWVPGIFLGGKGRPALKADNLTAISEPTVYKMWKPQRLTALWTPTASYRDSFTFTSVTRRIQKVMTLDSVNNLVLFNVVYAWFVLGPLLTE